MSSAPAPPDFSMTIDSPLGPLSLEGEREALVRLHFGASRRKPTPCPLLRDAARELSEYFEAGRRSFSIPYRLEGTEFQRAVWEGLANVEFGERVSYAELARRIGRPHSVRAVGNALGKNRLPILLPCHRVVASANRWGGFTGGLGIKRFLLALEGSDAALI